MERYQQQFQALGSTVLITLVTKKDLAYAQKLFRQISLRISRFEQQFSRFLTDSELTQFNQRAGIKVSVSQTFLKLLEVSKDLSNSTDGLYNPFILPALQQAGYLGSWTSQRTELAINDYRNRKTTIIDNLIIGDSWAKIPKNSALDFGGIGKGYLLDELSRTLSNKMLSGYWLSLGGDIICAGFDLDNEFWKVAIQDANDNSQIIDYISNQTGNILAIATSGITKRHGIKNGQSWHHIIDPRTRKPAITDILTATVTADQAVRADVYAKCIVIAGAKQAKTYKRQGVIQSFLLQLNSKVPALIKSRLGS
ncbi:MAG: FAD:protein FMN transferase [Candidatus Saccharimonadales bacterium]|jgi:thiamine biosynthesis lipoprotein